MTDADPAWTALRQKHESLVGRLAAPQPGLSAEIRTYIGELARAGETLGDYESRLLAQTMLNYWTAEWVALTGGLEPFDPPVLSDFAGGAQRDAPASDPSDVRMIRLGAAARLWKESGRKPGYLLAGNTIEEASQFSKQDPDIGELVQASQARRQSRKLLFTVIGLSALVGMISVITAGVFVLVPATLKATGVSLLLSPTDERDTSDRLAKRILRFTLIDLPKGCDETRSGILTGLAFVQRVTFTGSSDFDFSRAKLPGLCVDGISLRMISFASATLESSSFKGATLPNSVFSDATMPAANFEGANLRFAQFKGTSARNARFDGAALFRASFEGAKLEGASFRGADLRKVSFARAIFGPEFPEGFSGTAWWLAEGWTPDQELQLARLNSAGLRDSAGYQAVIAENLGEIRNTRPRTADRADSLNALAWSLARFGEDLSAGAGAGADCPPDAAVPTTAIEAANGAVCTARDLNLSPDRVGNFLDTQGYVLLQLGRADLALPALREAFEDAPLPDTQFRLGVAQIAAGQVDEGTQTVRSAMVEKHYQPTHELQRLKAYIKGDLATMIEQAGLSRNCPP